MNKLQSTKLFDGYSCCFRQWRAEGTHCKYLHGYGVSFKTWFEGELDERNWIWDFGGMKRAKGQIDGFAPKDWIDNLLDHTVIVANDDPWLSKFQRMDEAGILRLRVLPSVGAERFAEFLAGKLGDFVKEETNGRVNLVKLEFFEHEKNSAIWTND